MGYHRAGFDVVGVDIEPQPRYPFEFIQADAITYLKNFWYAYDAVHASPPCQAYTNAKTIRGRSHPDLIRIVRGMLKYYEIPYVIENVPGAPLIHPVQLVGTMFGLRTMRPRLFECSFPVPFELAPPAHARHAKMGRLPKPDEFMTVVGNFSGVAQAKAAMGIDWMSRDGLREAIPPAYTEYIGGYLMRALKLEQAG